MKNYKHPNDRGYTNPELFVTTDWLEDNINKPNLQIVDVDSPEEYRLGHIPGASNPIDNFYKTSLEDRTHLQAPEIFSETTVATSFADLIISALIASRTLILDPASK